MISDISTRVSFDTRFFFSFVEEYCTFILFIMTIYSIRKQGEKRLVEVASRSFPLGHSGLLLFLGRLKYVTQLM